LPEWGQAPFFTGNQVFMIQNAWHVHKFGGSSLSDAQCFSRVANILLAEPGVRQAVIVSAMGGMTDALLTLVSQAEKSADTIEAGLQANRRYIASGLSRRCGGRPEPGPGRGFW
jgi:aspartokinase